AAGLSDIVLSGAPISFNHLSYFVMAGLDPAIAFQRHQIAGSSPAMTMPGDERRCLLLLRPPPFVAGRRDQHAVDAAAVHLDDLEAPVGGGDAVGDHRHPV